jgi:hypothetical protein
LVRVVGRDTIGVAAHQNLHMKVRDNEVWRMNKTSPSEVLDCT